VANRFSDRWSQYCILGLEGETLAEGQLRTTQEDVREFFQALTVARVVIEVGTHSAWVQDVITEWGHEVMVANPRLMERVEASQAEERSH
jgi:transposase